MSAQRLRTSIRDFLKIRCERKCMICGKMFEGSNRVCAYCNVYVSVILK